MDRKNRYHDGPPRRGISGWPISKVLLWLLVWAALYVFLATGYYRFTHPELTETELFYAIPDAVLWR